MRGALTSNTRHLEGNLMFEPNKHSLLLILEHFTTAKLVTTTSRTPNGSRSAAASDVSSRVFILPSPSRPVTSFRLCRYTSHHIHYMDPRVLPVQQKFLFLRWILV